MAYSHIQENHVIRGLILWATTIGPVTILRVLKTEFTSLTLITLWKLPSSWYASCVRGSHFTSGFVVRCALEKDRSNLKAEVSLSFVRNSPQATLYKFSDPWSIERRTMLNESNASCKEAERSPAAAIAAALHDGKKHLLAASGSVAAIKLHLIISSLANHHNLSIRVILTKSATNFLPGQSPERPTVASLSLLPNVDSVLKYEDEWIEPWKRDTKILHIDLRKWAHLLVVAPLLVNILAKVLCGFADNLLTSVIRTWDINPMDPKRARIIVAHLWIAVCGITL